MSEMHRPLLQGYTSYGMYKDGLNFYQSQICIHFVS